jgi:hypothetical protein
VATCLQIQGHSKPWIFVFKFKDIEGLSSFVWINPDYLRKISNVSQMAQLGTLYSFHQVIHESEGGYRSRLNLHNFRLSCVLRNPATLAQSRKWSIRMISSTFPLIYIIASLRCTKSTTRTWRKTVTIPTVPLHG